MGNKVSMPKSAKTETINETVQRLQSDVELLQSDVELLQSDVELLQPDVELLQLKVKTMEDARPKKQINTIYDKLSIPRKRTINISQPKIIDKPEKQIGTINISQPKKIDTLYKLEKQTGTKTVPMKLGGMPKMPQIPKVSMPPLPKSDFANVKSMRESSMGTLKRSRPAPAPAFNLPKIKYQNTPSNSR